MTTVLLAGGGTGGHVFPMIAVADALSEIAPTLRLVFVGTERGLESKLVPERGYPLELVRVLPIKGGGLSGAARGVARAAMSLPESRGLIRRLAPSAVFSIGGYAAGPVTLAAWASRIPVALMEPNTVTGLANRLVAPLVRRAYTAFPESEVHFSRKVVLRSGVPIRGGFEPRDYRRHEALEVLVLGGSQGARSLNEAVPQALAKLEGGVRVVHQTGRGNGEAVGRCYAELGLAAHTRVVEFIEDMPSALMGADLVVSRSGASAVSEICAIGRPSLLIPYPYAAGDHQRLNAESLAREGAAVVVADAEASAEQLAKTIDELRAPNRLEELAAAARDRGRPEAAHTIARDLLALAGLDEAGAPTPSPAVSGPDSGSLAMASPEGA